MSPPNTWRRVSPHFPHDSTVSIRKRCFEYSRLQCSRFDEPRSYWNYTNSALNVSVQSCCFHEISSGLHPIFSRRALPFRQSNIVWMRRIYFPKTEEFFPTFSFVEPFIWANKYGAPKIEKVDFKPFVFVLNRPPVIVTKNKNYSLRNGTLQQTQHWTTIIVAEWILNREFRRIKANNHRQGRIQFRFNNSKKLISNTMDFKW